MHTYTTIIVNSLIVMLSVVELMLTSSIYDFIVTHELFYAYPRKLILIASSGSFFKYITTFISFFLSFAAILLISCRFDRPTNIYCIIAYRIMQFGCAIFHTINCSNSLQTAQKVAIFITNDEAYDFITAAWWYTIRLRLSAILFAATSILTLVLVFHDLNVEEHRSDKISSISYDQPFNVGQKKGMFHL